MEYNPAEDSFLLLKHVKKKAKNKSVLDMGAGFGILAETAKEAGAKSVLAADISKEAVEHVKFKGIPAVQSNLFSEIKGKFDLIIFNPPYLPEHPKEDRETKRVVCGGKKGYETIERFLKQAKKHLNKNGEVLFVFSSLTNKSKVDEILRRCKYRFKCLEEEKCFYEILYVYECH